MPDRLVCRMCGRKIKIEQMLESGPTFAVHTRRQYDKQLCVASLRSIHVVNEWVLMAPVVAERVQRALYEIGQASRVDIEIEVATHLKRAENVLTALLNPKYIHPVTPVEELVEEYESNRYAE